MSTLQAAALTGRREVIVDTRGKGETGAATVASISDQDWYIRGRMACITFRRARRMRSLRC